jgi:hypothetical protein
MISNGSDGLLWTLIGPAIWMALLLSVLSSKADGAVEIDARGQASAPQITVEATTALMSIEPLTFHASVDCVESLGDGA